MNCSLPGSSVHGISQQEYWSVLSFPSPGGLPNSEIEPGSPALQADSSLSEPWGKPRVYTHLKIYPIFQLKKVILQNQLLFSHKLCLTLCEPMDCSMPCHFAKCWYEVWNNIIIHPLAMVCNETLNWIFSAAPPCPLCTLLLPVLGPGGTPLWTESVGDLAASLLPLRRNSSWEGDEGRKESIAGRWFTFCAQCLVSTGWHPLPRYQMP